MSFSVSSNELVAVIGPVGSGKVSHPPLLHKIWAACSHSGEFQTIEVSLVNEKKGEGEMVKGFIQVRKAITQVLAYLLL